MDTFKKSNQYIDDDVMIQFNSLMAKFILLEKRQVFRSGDDCYTSNDLHLIDTIGRFPHANVTEIANHQGVTKGAISQKLNRFEKAGLICRYKDSDNSKEVLIELTDSGWEMFHAHMVYHQTVNRNIFDSLTQMTPENLIFLKNLLHIFNEHLNHFLEMGEIDINTVLNLIPFDKNKF